MSYRYKESGLDNVVLPRSAYTIRKTPYGETVAIHDVDRLHRKIAAKLVRQPHLTGAELRFLRLEMDQTQAELAKKLGTSEQTLSLWERDRNKLMPETADKLLRIIADVRLKLGLRGFIERAIIKPTAKAAKKRAPATAKKRRSERRRRRLRLRGRARAVA